MIHHHQSCSIMVCSARVSSRLCGRTSAAPMITAMLPRSNRQNEPLDFALDDDGTHNHDRPDINKGDRPLSIHTNLHQVASFSHLICRTRTRSHARSHVFLASEKGPRATSRQTVPSGQSDAGEMLYRSDRNLGSFDDCDGICECRQRFVNVLENGGMSF